MSFVPTTENQRKRYPSQSMQPYSQNRLVSTSAQTYPVHAAAPADQMMGSPRNWQQQNAVYPYVIPEQGRSSYGNNMGSMATMAPSYPTASTAPLAGPSNTHMIKSPYVTPYPDPWNNMYDTVTPMSAEQPGWERSNMGFGGYQQHSPSRSDGSASTQVSSLSSPYTHPSPLIKLEHQPDLSPYGSRFAFENAALQPPISMGTTTAPITSPQSHRPFTTSLVSYGHPAEDVKYDFDSYDLESLSLSGDPRMLKSESQSKRGYTTPEEATCSCDICGQSFKRSNNLKTHMQTHATHRSQPHKCEYEDCSRAFGRKTDLVRHEQSTRRRRVFQTTTGQNSNDAIPSLIIEAFLIIRALSIACYVAASPSTAIDVTYVRARSRNASNNGGRLVENERATGAGNLITGEAIGAYRVWDG